MAIAKMASEEYVKRAIASTVAGGAFRIVTVLPNPPVDMLSIYLVPKANGEEQNSYDEYIWVDSAWEKIGDTTIDLSGYVQTNDSRLSDARTPTAHKSSHATGGSDAIAPSDIGAAASSHTHAASDITLGLATVATTGSYDDLIDKPTIPTVPTNVSAFTNDAGYVTTAALRYDLGTTIAASAQLADRTLNRVAPSSDNATAIVLTFPAAITGKARDFLALVTNTTGNTGSISFTTPTGATIYGDGFGSAIAESETWLFSITEVADNTFFTKAVKMETPA